MCHCRQRVQGCPRSTCSLMSKQIFTVSTHVCFCMLSWPPGHGVSIHSSLEVIWPWGGHVYHPSQSGHVGAFISLFDGPTCSTAPGPPEKGGQVESRTSESPRRIGHRPGSVDQQCLSNAPLSRIRCPPGLGRSRLDSPRQGAGVLYIHKSLSRLVGPGRPAGSTIHLSL